MKIARRAKCSLTTTQCLSKQQQYFSILGFLRENRLRKAINLLLGPCQSVHRTDCVLPPGEKSLNRRTCREKLRDAILGNINLYCTVSNLYHAYTVSKLCRLDQTYTLSFGKGMHFMLLITAVMERTFDNKNTDLLDSYILYSKQQP